MVSNWQSAVSKRGSETLPDSGEKEGGEGGEDGKRGRMEGGKKSENVSEGRNRRRLTVYVPGDRFYGRGPQFFKFFIVEQQKSGDFPSQKFPFGCMLFNLVFPSALLFSIPLSSG